MKNPFLVHPNLKEVHQTSDGTFFYTANAAANHAKTLEDKTVQQLKSSDFKQDKSTQKADEAKAKADAEAAAQKAAEDKAKADEAANVDAAGQKEGEGQSIPLAPTKIYTKDELDPMKRFELDAIAVALGFDPSELANKGAVVAAILEFQTPKA